MGALLQITSSLAVPFFAKIHETQLIDLCLHGEILATVGVSSLQRSRTLCEHRKKKKVERRISKYGI